MRLPPNKAFQRTINSSVQLTLVALWRLQRTRDDLSSSEVLGMPTLKMSAMALRIGGVDWLYAGYIRVYVAAPRCP